MRTRHLIGSAWLLAAVFTCAPFAQAEEAPATPAKPLLSTKLPQSDFSLALKADQFKGSPETNPTPSALVPQRESVMPFVGFSLSKPLDYPK
jgi:hypothetical protein